MSLPFSSLTVSVFLDTGIALLVLTTTVAVSRISLSIYANRRFRWDDGWLAFACACYIAMTILYMYLVPLYVKMVSAEIGLTPPYAGLIDDAIHYRKMEFPATLLLWVTLWSVKFSLLSFYKPLVSRLKSYLRLWYGAVVFCFVCWVACSLSFVFACGTKDMENGLFGPFSCAPSVTPGSSISLWLSYALDVLTDMIVTLFPVGVLKKAHMPFRQKASLGCVFLLDIVCIIVATIRATEVGSTILKSIPDVLWLALWSLVESSIAIIIGCTIGLYRDIKSMCRPKQPSYTGYSMDDMRSRNAQHSRADSISHQKATTRAYAQGGQRYHSEATSSQEELAKPTDITVTRSTMVGYTENDNASEAVWNYRRRSADLTV